MRGDTTNPYHLHYNWGFPGKETAKKGGTGEEWKKRKTSKEGEGGVNKNIN